MLRDLEILVLDCQASGATPEHGDLLEIGWGFAGPRGVRDVEAYWIRPKRDIPISKPVRQLLGWSEECLACAIEAEEAWDRLRARAPIGTPAVIHWARFERPFLAALNGGQAPFDVRCLHAIADRLFPDLPKMNLRALAGFLGHSTDLVRRARGHVEATAHVWNAIAPRLAAEGVTTWSDLDAFLARPVPRARDRKLVFPFPPEKRKQLRDAPGIYRFLRSNGDVLYVGKAASIKKRVASHFSARAKKNDALEMLTQVADVSFAETPTALEAALLEVDEIQRLDPPYNVQLRVGERRVWFASRDFDDARDAPDADHPIGPLPSRRALAGLAAMRRLLAGEAPTPALRAAAVGVPPMFTPSADAFDLVWKAFAPRVPLLEAGRALHPFEEEAPPEDDDGSWTAERIARHLARTLASETLLVRRARLLSLLPDARVTFREKGDELEQRIGEPAPRPRARMERQRSFDARRYDRYRVLATELRRVHLEGGSVEIRIGVHRLPVERLFASI